MQNLTRQPVFARDVIATSQPLATSAGLEVFAAGGNAVDAALAAAICLTVVEPTSNGIGGDAFAIVWDGQSLHAMEAAGRSPASLDPRRFTNRPEMPVRGWDAVTVPGCVAGWADLHAKLGRLPFERLFAPAVRHAEAGFPLSPVTAAAWQASFPHLKDFAGWRETFAPHGRAPTAGEVVRLPEHAATLRRIAETAGRDFYEGETAAMILAAARQAGADLAATDLTRHATTWPGTASVLYRGHRVHQLPPPGQGIAALMALRLVELAGGHDLPPGVQATHLHIEAMKLAFADAHAHLAEPAHMAVSPDDLLCDAYIAERLKLIDPASATAFTPGTGKPGGTVYLSAADRDGRLISYIQSNYYGFGSGIVPAGTGVALQNRGYGFCTTPGHPNCVAAGKKPFHTIIPGFVTRDTDAGVEPVMAFGVMGGPMQPQGHLQVLERVLCRGESPQKALDAARWRVRGERDVMTEPELAKNLLEGLAGRGHRIWPAGYEAFGGGQAIRRAATSAEGQRAWEAASDWRKDGHAAGL